MSFAKAEERNVPVVFNFVRELAEYERLAHEVDATETNIAKALFGPIPRVFADIAEWGRESLSASHSEFYKFFNLLDRHGIYLEGLFARLASRSKRSAKLC